MNLSEELKEEIKRKLGRFVLGTAIILSIIYTINTYNHVVLLNAGFIIVLLAIFLDYLRVDQHLTLPFFHGQFILRSAEKCGVHNVTFASISYLFALVFFDLDIALAAIGISVFADGLAAIAGKGFGKTKIRNGKSLEGSLTMLITSLIVGILFLKNIWLVLVMVMIATLLELFVKNYPDDLIIPLCAGFGAQLTAAIFGLRPLAKGYSIGFIVWGILVIGLAAIFSLSALYKKIRG